MKELRKLTRKRQILFCNQCNQPYSPYPYKNETSRYCSRKCYVKSKQRQPQTCQECGDYFYRDRKAKYCSRKCSFKHTTPPPVMNKKGEQHPGIRSRMQKLGISWEEYNNWKEDKKRYYREVWRLTNQQDISQLQNFDKPRTRAGIEGGFQLDHIISIEEGWSRKLAPSVVGSINNLQFIPWLDNLKKRYEK